jgi:hypothetical protein
MVASRSPREGPPRVVHAILLRVHVIGPAVARVAGTAATYLAARSPVRYGYLYGLRMATPSDAVEQEPMPLRVWQGWRGLHLKRLRAAVRADLIRVGQRHGYVASQQWQAAIATLIDHDLPSADRGQLRDELSRVAATQNWLFPDAAPPSDARSRLDVLVELARAHASRTTLFTRNYLSAWLALGCRWGLAHDELAHALARTCVAEHWNVDWELACEMEGLLGAELAYEHERAARSGARNLFEGRARKSWLSKSDLLAMFSELRTNGVSDLETRALLNSYHLEADARGWPWPGAPTRPRTRDESLRLLVGKVAAQARRKRHIPDGFRQALFAEAAGSNIDSRTLLQAINASVDRDYWFDEHGLRRVFGTLYKRLAPFVRELTPSGLRIAAPLALVLTAASFNGPVAVSPIRPSPQSTLSAESNPTLTVVAPTMVVREESAASTPAPAPVRPPVLVVSHTDGVGARLRTAPATGPVARLLGEGSSVVMVGSEMQVDGTTWVQVRALDGTPGWLAADLLDSPEAPAG